MQSRANSISCQIAAAIASSPHVAGVGLTYEAHEGHVVLKGTVGTYFEKQMAQEALRHVEGIGRIVNDVQVNW